MKKTIYEALIDQIIIWKIGDSIEDIMQIFNEDLALTEDEEMDFNRLRKEIDELLETSS